MKTVQLNDAGYTADAQEAIIDVLESNFGVEA